MKKNTTNGRNGEALARTIAGFVSIKTFYAGDVERVSIVEFETEEAHEEWKNHPVHLEAQRLGREKFYSGFKIQVMNDSRSYGFETDFSTNVKLMDKFERYHIE